jgi:hypothetical protein
MNYIDKFNTFDEIFDDIIHYTTKCNAEYTDYTENEDVFTYQTIDNCRHIFRFHWISLRLFKMCMKVAYNNTHSNDEYRHFWCVYLAIQYFVRNFPYLLTS